MQKPPGAEPQKEPQEMPGEAEEGEDAQLPILPRAMSHPSTPAGGQGCPSEGDQGSLCTQTRSVWSRAGQDDFPTAPAVTQEFVLWDG